MFKITTISRTLLADTATPVSIYLRLRDVFPNSILLESSDYHSRENAMSYVCCEPFAGVVLENGVLTSSFPDGSTTIEQEFDVTEAVTNFTRKFEVLPGASRKLIHNGLFGYFTWEISQYVEDIAFRERENEQHIPAMQYHFYRYIIAIDHFKNEVTLFQNAYEDSDEKQLDTLIYHFQNKDFTTFRFNPTGSETSTLSDQEFLDLVERMKKHISRGDVFQIVPSRGFSQEFKGDEFNVYRCLRSINPSPYLFYFDYGNFRLFGSSPESQITISNGEASIFPIAGTFKRTGNDEEDTAAARALENDAKESAEHVMLVDLARNDLSRNCDAVTIRAFKEIQYYSHLIHLVSRVSGTIKPDISTFDVVADTYPAGTLSGAPKYKAMELLDEYESTGRNFYGGAIGYMGFNGDFNHAIMIRTFLSARNTLQYRAGAGIVFHSDARSELQEVENKVTALRKAIEMAAQLQ